MKLESGCPALNLTFSAEKSGSSSRMAALKKQDNKEETYFNIMVIGFNIIYLLLYEFFYW